MSTGQERQGWNPDRALRALVARVEALERKGTPTGTTGGVAYATLISQILSPSESIDPVLAFNLPTRSSCVGLFVGFVAPTGTAVDMSGRATVTVGNAAGDLAIAQISGSVSGSAYALAAASLDVLDPGTQSISLNLQNLSTSGDLSFTGGLYVMSFLPSGSLAIAVD